MALTRITKGVIKPNENYDTHNINSTGIVTAIGLDVNGNGDISGNLSVGGVLTYEDVTSIDSVGIITARNGIDCNGDIDVDGHTNLDNVSIAGVTTFSNTVHVGTGVTIETNGQGTFSGIVTSRGFNVPQTSDNGATNSFIAGRIKIFDPGSQCQIQFGTGPSYAPHQKYASAMTYRTNTFTLQNTGSTRTALGWVHGSNHASGQGSVNLYYSGGYAPDYGVKLSTHSGGINVTGVTTTRDLAVTGVSTFTGNIDANGDLDVDGHTNLDNVSIAGLTTFSGRIDSDTINISAHNDIRFASGNWSGNITKIQNHNNYLYIVAPSNGFQFRIGATDLWLMDSISNDGNFWPTVDSGRDIGKSNRRIRNLYATTLYGDGSNLTGITQTTINSNADNRVITGSGTANTLNGESNLTFNGNSLSVTNSSSNTAATFQGAAGAGFIAIKDGDDSTVAYIGVDGGSLKFQTSGSSYSDKLLIDTSGRLLVNTPNPINTSTSKFQVASNDANGSAILARFNASVYSSYLDFYKSRSNTLGTAYVVNDDDHLGSIRYYGADGSNSGYTTAAEIYGSCDGGSGGSGDMPGRITFHTRPDGAGQAMKERVRINSAGKVLVGDGSVITPSRNLDVRGTGHQQILIGSTNNSGASLMIDGHGGGDGSGGNYATVEMGSDGHLDIRNYDAAKNIVFGVGSSTGAEDTLVLKSNGDLGLSNTGTNNPNTYSTWCTFTVNGTAGAELDFEKGGSLKGDILAHDTAFNMTTRDSAVDINFATKNNAGSTANRLTISSEGNIRHVDGSGVSYFNGASEYIFGSTGSSPSSGGAEANVQIHAHKTRAQFSINAYMNNAGGPYMQLVSSRSGTVGTLGAATANNDALGSIRFSADDGNGGVVYGAEIGGKAKSAATTNGIAGRLEFFTAKDSSSTIRQVFSMNEGGALTAESENAALYGHYTSVNNGNHYVDFPQWTRDSFIILEIFGNVNPNSAGGGYVDPLHMYVYRGTGWTGSRQGHYIYSVSVAPPARHAFPSGTGYSGNAQVSAVWTDGSSVIGNETATSTHYMRLLIPNANASYSFPKQFRIFRRR